jgi:hypothetical protein
MNMSDKADAFVVWCMRRFEKGETRSRPTMFNFPSAKIVSGRFVVGREPVRDWENVNVHTNAIYYS